MSETCTGFQWIGQSFEHCEGCGRDIRDHQGLNWIKPGATPFGSPDEARELIPFDEAMKRIPVFAHYVTRVDGRPYRWESARGDRSVGGDMNADTTDAQEDEELYGPYPEPLIEIMASALIKGFRPDNIDRLKARAVLDAIRSPEARPYLYQLLGFSDLRFSHGHKIERRAVGPWEAT